MKGANRLLRVVWIRPAPGFVSRKHGLGRRRGSARGRSSQTPARSWLTDEAHKASTKSAARRRKERRDGAPKGATHRKMRALTKGCADWRAVPLFYEGQGMKAYPAPFSKNTGGGALAV